MKVFVLLAAQATRRRPQHGSASRRTGRRPARRQRRVYSPSTVPLYMQITPPAASAPGRAAGSFPGARRSIFWRQAMRTNVYIDGFNLFYGQLKGGPHKWLNIEHLFTALLPRNDIQRIRYFTARVEPRAHDPNAAVRQATYLRALGTLPLVEVHFGTFLSSAVRAPVLECGADGKPLKVNNRPVVKHKPSGAVKMEWVYKTEEKGSDVNLASHLLRDALKGDWECAVVVSNDSDLLTPIRMAQQDGNVIVGLSPPRSHGSMELKRLVNFKKDFREHQLIAAQFPTTLQDATGTITKPAEWP